MRLPGGGNTYLVAARSWGRRCHVFTGRKRRGASLRHRSTRAGFGCPGAGEIAGAVAGSAIFMGRDHRCYVGWVPVAGWLAAHTRASPQRLCATRPGTANTHASSGGNCLLCRKNRLGRDTQPLGSQMPPKSNWLSTDRALSQNAFKLSHKRRLAAGQGNMLPCRAFLV